MTQETRALGAEELVEKVIPTTRMSKESVERQMFKKIQSGADFYMSYRDLLYVISNASIRSYFEGKSAPELSSGSIPKAERLGEPLPDGAAVADKKKAKKKAPAKKKTVTAKAKPKAKPTATSL